MATTENFNWPTPNDTDLVKFGAAAIRALGDAADATVDDLQNRNLTAGDGLAGGGDLTDDRTFTVDGTVMRNNARQQITSASSTTESLLDLQATTNAGADATLLSGSISSGTTNRYFMSFSGLGGSLWRVSTDAVLRDGTVPFERLSNVPSGIYAGTRYFFGDGTFSVTNPLLTGDIGLKAVRVRLVGGGAGGRSRSTSNANASFGGGGGGGAYAEKFFLRSALPSSVSVAVGAGGSQNVNGNPSQFHTVTAGGGDRSGIRNTSDTGQVTSNGSGGTASGGDINVRGGDGHRGVYVGSGQVFSGQGGSSMFSGSTQGEYAFGSGGTNGRSATGFGGGGTSGVVLPFGGFASGGSGSSGVVIVDCFV